MRIRSAPGRLVSILASTGLVLTGVVAVSAAAAAEGSPSVSPPAGTSLTIPAPYEWRGEKGDPQSLTITLKNTAASGTPRTFSVLIVGDKFTATLDPHSDQRICTLSPNASCDITLLPQNDLDIGTYVAELTISELFAGPAKGSAELPYTVSKAETPTTAPEIDKDNSDLADATVFTGTTVKWNVAVKPADQPVKTTYQWETSKDSITWTLVDKGIDAGYSPDTSTAGISLYRVKVTNTPEGAGEPAHTTSRDIILDVLTRPEANTSPDPWYQWGDKEAMPLSIHVANTGESALCYYATIDNDEGFEIANAQPALVEPSNAFTPLIRPKTGLNSGEHNVALTPGVASAIGGVCPEYPSLTTAPEEHIYRVVAPPIAPKVSAPKLRTSDPTQTRSLADDIELSVGDEATLEVTSETVDDELTDYTHQWQTSTDGETWTDVENNPGLTLKLDTANAATAHYRVVGAATKTWAKTDTRTATAEGESTRVAIAEAAEKPDPSESPDPSQKPEAPESPAAPGGESTTPQTVTPKHKGPGEQLPFTGVETLPLALIALAAVGGGAALALRRRSN